MIKNEKQYRLTRAQIVKFEQALDDFRRNTDSSVHPALRQAEQDALEGQLSELKAEVQEYEDLVAGRHQSLLVATLADLPTALIKARIAQGLTQAQLAARLGMKEQQVQRYEATDYESASIKRLQEVAQALGLTIRNEIQLPATQVTPQGFVQRIKEIGLDKELVFKRFLPASLSAKLEAVERGTDAGALVSQAVAYVARVFDWTPNEVLGSESLQFNPVITGAGRFKMPAKAAKQQVTVYTVYAHYLALVLLQATVGLPRREVPVRSKEVRESIMRDYGALTFETVLRYVWDLGIPVLPLRDSGTFHGACWRSQGQNVIVLKQRTQSNARMMFDLLHELRHAGEEPDQDQLSIIEDSETSNGRRLSKPELIANQFSGNVLLDGRAEQILERCLSLAQSDVKYLKSVVPRVAQQEGVSVGALANYVAFRLAMEGHNWWGTAHSLQEPGPDPWGVARDLLLTRTDLSTLSPMDRQLLVQALSE